MTPGTTELLATYSLLIPLYSVPSTLHQIFGFNSRLISREPLHRTLYSMSNSISPKATVPTRWVVESLSQVVRHQDPRANLHIMLDALLNFKKEKTVFHHLFALFMLRGLTRSQLAATDATIENLKALFNISFDLSRMGSKPWRLQSEQYEMPRRLSNKHC